MEFDGGLKVSPGRDTMSHVGDLKFSLPNTFRIIMSIGRSRGESLDHTTLYPPSPQSVMLVMYSSSLIAALLPTS